jgi:hypothetical protein
MSSSAESMRRPAATTATRYSQPASGYDYDAYDDEDDEYDFRCSACCLRSRLARCCCPCRGKSAAAGDGADSTSAFGGGGGGTGGACGAGGGDDALVPSDDKKQRPTHNHKPTPLQTLEAHKFVVLVVFVVVLIYVLFVVGVIVPAATHGRNPVGVRDPRPISSVQVRILCMLLAAEVRRPQIS